jgi:hypothetical protein
MFKPGKKKTKTRNSSSVFTQKRNFDGACELNPPDWKIEGIRWASLFQITPS